MPVFPYFAQWLGSYAKPLYFKPEQVEFFEPFWDSGEPRAGEKGARGWRAWMHQQERGGWVVVSPGEAPLS